MRIVTILNKKAFKGHKNIVVVVYIYNPWKKRVPREKFARMARFAWDHEIRH